MRSEGKRTPGPWKLMGYADGEIVEVQGLRDGIWIPIAVFRVADLGQWQKENAAFIVKACNAYDRMLEAMENTLERVENNNDPSGIAFYLRNAIEEAKLEPR